MWVNLKFGSLIIITRMAIYEVFRYMPVCIDDTFIMTSSTFYTEQMVKNGHVRSCLGRPAETNFEARVRTVKGI